MTTSAKRLGYGGSATIFGVQVVVTGGSFDRAVAPSTLDMLDLPSILDGTMQKRGRVLHALGTSTFTGSLNFDVSTYAINNVIKVDRILDRNWEFDVGIHDGENHYLMENRLSQTVSLSGSPGGLINCSVSFMGINDKIAGGAVTNSYILDYDSDPSNQPAAYWWSGGDDIRDWSFSYTQDVVPMYGNTAGQEPKYMRAGLVSYSLQVTTYSELSYNVIKIMTQTFSLTGVTTAEGYTFNGPSDLGMFSHSFETASISDASDGIVIS